LKNELAEAKGRVLAHVHVLTEEEKRPKQAEVALALQPAYRAADRHVAILSRTVAFRVDPTEIGTPAMGGPGGFDEIRRDRLFAAATVKVSQ
jgi:hypothetical protein